ncbi:MAG: L-aspartate oxidase [Wenzhouxiangella sp.]
MAEAPIIVVGSGIAGMWTALQAAPCPVMLLTAGRFGGQSATEWAQGGIAAALGSDDSPQCHARDTIAAGAGLVDEAVARQLAHDVVDQVRALEDLGVPFEHDRLGNWALSREAAHSRARIARVGGDRAGAAIVDALTAAVGAADHIEVRERCPVQAIVPDEHGACAGVSALAGGREPVTLTGRATVLATGGSGGLYALTTNPGGNQGQALAWAARLGAVVRDAEFVQFHPTAIDIDRNPAPLATEALRGEGAVLVNRKGRRFMPSIHPDAELAPRDVVARAVHRQVQSGEGAFLDVREAVGEGFPERFRAVYRACREGGIDPRREPIPVAPAAHYHMGGIAADLNGRTTVDRLLAVGEVACTGAHGANRLASNSLAEALVAGARAGRLLAGTAAAPGGSERIPRPAPRLPDRALDELRRAMSTHAGVERDGSGLDRLIGVIESLESRFGRADPLIAARFIATGASKRTESRGAHYRLDHPEPGSRAESGRMTLAQARAFCSHGKNEET